MLHIKNVTATCCTYCLIKGMSAGSVPVECLFSVMPTGLICNSRRSSVCPSKLSKISFLHDNLDCIQRRPTVLSVCDEYRPNAVFDLSKKKQGGRRSIDVI